MAAEAFPGEHAMLDDIEQRIGAYLALKDPENAGRFVADWVVFTSSRSPLTDDTRYQWVTPSAKPALHTVVGLVDVVMLLMKNGVVTRDD